jgi:DNA-binding Lrp family transcriptional regulator
MSVSAYILIQADVGTAVDVAEATAAIDAVISAEVAMGPYDVIARAEAPTMDDLGQVVVHAVQNITGVQRTLLCPIVNV